MCDLSEIEPTERKRVIDLVRDAGVDVNDWAACEGGEEKAASNPKYCYEWSFVEPKKTVVLNLWYGKMEERDGAIVQDLNYRDIAREPANPVGRKTRAMNMDRAIRTAAEDELPIRVIVCDGKMRDKDDPNATASLVKKRLLDPVPWAVTAYNSNSGQCTVSRGALVHRFGDQFSILEESIPQPRRRPLSRDAFVRDPAVRRRTILRAQGKCELCKKQGFTMADGTVFLETHHVISLAEGGADTEGNVVALCPNDHREAHYGANSEKMRKDLLDRLCHL
jgi:5-methylcytosine-specific restriction protein A